MATIILIEGLDASGKSTVVETLAESYRAQKKMVRTFQSPGHTEGAKAIRQFVKFASVALTPAAQFLLFSAAAADAIGEIRATCEDPAVDYVILDRWHPSSKAYQGAQGVSVGSMYVVQSEFCDLPGLSLQLSFYLDVPEAVRNERRKQRGINRADRYESRGDDYMRKVEANYKRLVGDGALRCIDANRPALETVADIMHCVAVYEAERASQRTLFR